VPPELHRASRPSRIELGGQRCFVLETRLGQRGRVVSGGGKDEDLRATVICRKCAPAAVQDDLAIGPSLNRGGSIPGVAEGVYSTSIASVKRFVDGITGPQTRRRERRGHQKQIGRSRCFGSARFDWWAVKDSNLGPAD